MRLTSFLARTAVAGCLALAAAAGAAAQDAAALYAGKTMTLVIGAPPGSDEDSYGRLVARYLGSHIAGHPTLAVRNVPDGGGQFAAGSLASAVGEDGTVMALLPAHVLTAPLWFGTTTAQYDATKFIYLGSAAAETTDCFVGAETPIESLRDAFVRDVPMGALAGGGPTRDGPVLLNAILGTKFRVAASYGTAGDILGAIEKGAVMGACGLSWSSISRRHPDWLLKGVLRGLVQESVTGAPLATRLGIPLAADFVSSAADREVLAHAYAWQAFAMPFVLPPASPPDRAAVLRDAFIATLKDTALLADAKQTFIAIDPTPGETVADLIAKLYATPDPIADRVRAALTVGTGRQPPH